MDKLSASEEQALQAAWQVGEGNVKAILEKLEAPVPPYTTLASTVKNLEKKGFLASRQVGNMYLYRATITEEEYKKGYMGNFIKDYYASDAGIVKTASAHYLVAVLTNLGRRYAAPDPARPAADSRCATTWRLPALGAAIHHLVETLP